MENQINISKFTSLIKRLEFSYKKEKAKARVLSVKRVTFICDVMVKISNAIKKEREGTHVCVYIDEY